MKKKAVSNGASRIWVLIPAVVFADQFLKFLALRYLHDIVVINQKLAFSISTQSVSSKLLSILTLIIIVCFAYIAKKRISRAAVSLVVAGATSNFIDRIFHGGVVDFINFKIWPIFNLADVAITLGLAWILIDLLLRPSSSQQFS